MPVATNATEAGKAQAEAIPAGVDYDQWVGPAPMKPFTKNRFHYNWQWQWAYGNGDLGNQGIHEIDIARWGLGVKYPTKISAIGGQSSLPISLPAKRARNNGSSQRSSSRNGSSPCCRLKRTARSSHAGAS